MARIKPGQRFGKWTTIDTIRITKPSGLKTTKWNVVCDCGTLQSADSYDLNKGKTTQCKSCYGTATVDLKGKTFGYWVVLEKTENKNGKTHWLCSCACGAIESVCAASLTKGVSIRCLKCYQKTMAKHGYTCQKDRHPLYNIWMSMIARCENEKCVSYRFYGFRGISVCERWHNLENFSSDMGPRPYRHSVDRIDNNGNYEPGNCRWANQKEQANNTRRNRIIEHDGESKTLTQWAEFLNVNIDTLYRYLTRNSFDKAYIHYSTDKK